MSIDFSIKEIILNMSPEALEEILKVIRARPDIAAVDVVTYDEVRDMDQKYKSTVTNFSEVKNEPA